MKTQVGILLTFVALLAALAIGCSSSDGEETGGGEGGTAPAAASSGEGGEAAADPVLYEYKLTQEVDFSAIEVTSDRITRIRRIGLEYSCATERSPVGFEFGQNLSPPLTWTGVPRRSEEPRARRHRHRQPSFPRVTLRPGPRRTSSYRRTPSRCECTGSCGTFRPR